jgi:hypothetical protein
MLALLVVFIQFYRHLYRQITTAIVGVGDGLNLSGNYVKQRAKLSRLGVETASNSFHPSM